MKSVVRPYPALKTKKCFFCKKSIGRAWLRRLGFGAEFGLNPCRHLPHLTWQPTELAEALPGLRMWLDEAGLDNIEQPLVLNLDDEQWPLTGADAAFTANLLHIISWPQVEHLFAGVSKMLEPGGIFCVYGPFNYHGQYTSVSNAQFDEWLKARDSQSGIRNYEDLVELGSGNGLVIDQDHEMPANNRVLIWTKRG